MTTAGKHAGKACARPNGSETAGGRAGCGYEKKIFMNHNNCETQTEARYSVFGFQFSGLAL